MQPEQIIISAALTISAVVLLGISLASYRHYRSGKLVFVSLAFLLFFVRGLLLTASLFVDVFDVLFSGFYIWIFDLAILALLFFAALKR